MSPTVATNVCDLQWDGKLSRFLHHLIDMTILPITTWSLFSIYGLATSQNMPGLREALFCVCVCLVGIESYYSSKFLWCIPQTLSCRYCTIELTSHFVLLKMVLYHYLRLRFNDGLPNSQCPVSTNILHCGSEWGGEMHGLSGASKTEMTMLKARCWKYGSKLFSMA